MFSSMTTLNLFEEAIGLTDDARVVARVPDRNPELRP